MRGKANKLGKKRSVERFIRDYYRSLCCPECGYEALTDFELQRHYFAGGAVGVRKAHALLGELILKGSS